MQPSSKQPAQLDLRQPDHTITLPPSPHLRGGDSRKWIMIGVAALLLITLVGGGIWYVRAGRPHVPALIVEKVAYPVYVPSALPKGYRLDPESFNVSQGALIFNAVNEAGDHISFSEQTKPKSFSLATFHEKSLKDNKNLASVPYPSILGKAEDDITLLSVETDKTWLIITAKTKTAAADLGFIARRITKN